MKNLKLNTRSAAGKLVLLILTLSILMSACATGAAKAPALLDSITVEPNTMTVQREDIYNLTYAEGCVLPQAETLLFPVDGMLGKMLVVAGQEVKKGDVLAELNMEVMLEQLETLKEQLDTQKGASEMNITRLTLIYQQRKEEQAQLEASGAGYYEQELKYIDVWEAWQNVEHAQQMQELELRSLENEVARLQEKVDACAVLTAPFDGVVTWVNPNAISNSKFAEETPLITVADPSKLYIASDIISATTLENCDRIYAVIGETEYELTARPRTNRQDVADAMNGVRLVSEFDFADGVKVDLTEGVNALVLCRSHYREQVLCVPTSALFNDSGSYYVYRVENNERVRVDVEIGVRTELRTEILSGLQEGDAVYVDD